MREDGRVRALIVDDEALARDIVREYLAKHAEISILGECSNGFEAVKRITEEAPDLLFLDIQMPKLNGFEVLELIGVDLAVIFTTAFDEYALRAFEVHAVDYLLKPFSQERFDEAVGRAMERVSAHSFSPIRALATDLGARRKIVDRVLVREGSEVHVLPSTGIDFVEAQDDYIRIKVGSRSYMKQQRLSELEECLDPQRFLRIHRSYILNIERIAKIELYAKDSRVAILTDGTRLPVSRSGYERVKNLL